MPWISLICMQNIWKEILLNYRRGQDYYARLRGVNFHPQLLLKVEVENALN